MEKPIKKTIEIREDYATIYHELLTESGEWKLIEQYPIALDDVRKIIDILISDMDRWPMKREWIYNDGEVPAFYGLYSELIDYIKK